MIDKITVWFKELDYWKQLILVFLPVGIGALSIYTHGTISILLGIIIAIIELGYIGILFKDLKKVTKK